MLGQSDDALLASKCSRTSKSRLRPRTEKWNIHVIGELEELIREISDLNSKLVLLVGSGRRGKTGRLRELGVNLNIDPLNLGLELARRLFATRTISAASRLVSCCVDRGQGLV